MIDISIIVPGIRVDRWETLYNSILTSTSLNFELIICGPYFPTKNLEDKKNFKFIRDFGTPVRASNLAASIAEGELITWGADDAVYLPGALDKLTNEFYHLEKNYKNILLCKYLEGEAGKSKINQPDSYFKLNGSHWTNSPRFSNDWYLFNVGIMYRNYFNILGGWDCNFEATFMSHSDLAARAYLDGAKIKFLNDLFLLDCDHFPGISGDHKPIHDAQTYRDLPKFKYKYNSLMELKLKKWFEVEQIWKERFDV